jgi:hypothetical protein
MARLSIAVAVVAVHYETLVFPNNPINYYYFITHAIDSDPFANRFLVILAMKLLLIIFKTFLASKMPIIVAAKDICICNNTWWTLMEIAADLVTHVSYVTRTTFVTFLTHVPFSEGYDQIVYYMIMFFFVIK